jgi:Ca2+-binding EF-hand superfamily protein
VARWLTGSQFRSLIDGLRTQLESGCDDDFTNVSISAMNVVEHFISDTHLGDFVMNEFYSSFIFLLNFPDVRHWALNTMIKLFHTHINHRHVHKQAPRKQGSESSADGQGHVYTNANKADTTHTRYDEDGNVVTKLLKRGFVEALFNSIIFLREFPRLTDPYCHLLNDDLDIIYHLDGLLDIVKVLLKILDIPAMHQTSPQTNIHASAHHGSHLFVKVRANAFHVHHVEMIRYLHLLICNELEMGKLSPEHADMVSLVNKLEELLHKMNELHAHSAIHVAMNTQTSEILLTWAHKLKESAAKGAEKLAAMGSHMMTVDSHGTYTSNGTSTNTLVPKRLVLHSTYVGTQEFEVLVTPYEWYLDAQHTILREEKLFVFPVAVSLIDMYAALNNHYAYVIRLYYSRSEYVHMPDLHSVVGPTNTLALMSALTHGTSNNGNLVHLIDETQLKNLIESVKSPTTLSLSDRTRPRIHLFVQPPKASDASTQLFTQSSSYQHPAFVCLPTPKQTVAHAGNPFTARQGQGHQQQQQQGKGASLSEVLKDLDMNLPPGVTVNEQFVMELYQVFHAHSRANAHNGNKEEIDVELFAQLLSARGIPEQVSRPLFRAFDRDVSGTLSWRECLLGLAKAKSPQHRLAIAFNAFDADGDGQLDFEETIELCHAHLPRAGVETAMALARECFNYLHLQIPSPGGATSSSSSSSGPNASNNKMTFKQFEELINSHRITLDTLLPDSLSDSLFVTNNRSNRVPASQRSKSFDSSQQANSGNNDNICKAFRAGSCKFGANCKFSHEL